MQRKNNRSGESRSRRRIEKETKWRKGEQGEEKGKQVYRTEKLINVKHNEE